MIPGNLVLLLTLALSKGGRWFKRNFSIDVPEIPGTPY